MSGEFLNGPDMTAQQAVREEKNEYDVAMQAHGFGVPLKELRQGPESKHQMPKQVRGNWEDPYNG